MRIASKESVLRIVTFALVLTAGLRPLPGATLERLSLDDMIVKSTSVVRGKVINSFGQFHGPVIYTHYRIQVSERYKGTGAGTTEIVVPGGSANGAHQQVAGAPELTVGGEYVLFLWTGASGNTHIIGLTQGLFAMASSDADPTVVRNVTNELMLDTSTGQTVRDTRLSMNLSALKSRIANLVKSSTKGTVQ
jgi:hypothetical protein